MLVAEVVLRKTSVVDGVRLETTSASSRRGGGGRAYFFFLVVFFFLLFFLGFFFLVVFCERRATGERTRERIGGCDGGGVDVIPAESVSSAGLVRAVAPTFLALVFFLTDFFLALVFFCNA